MECMWQKSHYDLLGSTVLSPSQVVWGCEECLGFPLISSTTLCFAPIFVPDRKAPYSLDQVNRVEREHLLHRRLSSEGSNTVSKPAFHRLLFSI